MAQRTAAHKRKLVLQHEGWAHGKSRVLDIRSGDLVEVIAGKDRGKRGNVLRTLPDEQRIVVEGVMQQKRHTKAGVKGATQGGIVVFSAPISYSNVQLVCNRCDKATRIAREGENDGSAHMVCKHCGERYERTAP